MSAADTGDLSRITPKKAGVQTMDSMATTDIEAQIEARFKTTAAAR